MNELLAQMLGVRDPRAFNSRAAMAGCIGTGIPGSLMGTMPGIGAIPAHIAQRERLRYEAMLQNASATEYLRKLTRRRIESRNDSRTLQSSFGRERAR